MLRALFLVGLLLLAAPGHAREVLGNQFTCTASKTTLHIPNQFVVQIAARAFSMSGWGTGWELRFLTQSLVVVHAVPVGGITYALVIDRNTGEYEVTFLDKNNPRSSEVVSGGQCFSHEGVQADEDVQAPARPVFADLNGRIASVTDGDTLKFIAENRSYTIRIEGIDAPERDQPFGMRSAENLVRRAHNKEGRAACTKQDRYGRLVCKVYVGGDDVGLKQIYDGFAWWYRKYAGEQSQKDRARYELEERDARVRRLGLWADPRPVPPWTWRAARRGRQ